MRIFRTFWAAALAVGLAGGVATAAGPRLAIDDDFPDPAVLRTSSGWYYVYATQGRNGDRMNNIQAARSRDMQSWERLPDVLPVKPRWASRTQDFWAPHVSAHEGRYYLYYSAKPDAALTDKTQGLCLAVATATRPEGPFTDIGHPLQCGEGFVNIDPMAFDDPATGKRLLYWGSGFQPIRVQELGPDRVSFAAGSLPRDLIAPVANERPDNYSRLVEGAWVTRHAGWYYLFYSGDNCCGPRAHYATMVARSRSATGPFVPLPGQVHMAGGHWLAPGHNSVTRDDRGRYWSFYHAVDTRRPRTAGTSDVNSRRVMLISEILWKRGVPIASGDATAAP